MFIKTEFALRTMKNEDLSLYGQTLQALSLQQNLGFHILQYEKQTLLINSKN